MNFKKIILLSFFFILVFLINSQIGLFGDDYYYVSFVKNNFFELHKNHYIEVNGRAIVHLLDSIFLALPKIFWSILNSLMISSIAYFASKIIALFSSKKNIFEKSIIIFLFSILTIDILVTRQSVYWITGSFNYIYPTFMFFWYWYTLLKYSLNSFQSKKILPLVILAFLASATVEQAGMMSFGATFLLFIFCFIEKKNYKTKYKLKNLGITLFSSFLGIASVIFSPAQFVRFKLESKGTFSFLDSAKNCVTFLINTFTQKYIFLLSILLFVILISLLTIKKYSKYNNYQIYLIISSIILGLGSQLMMIVSPVYGERNTLFGFFMLTFFLIILVSKLPDYNNYFYKTISFGFYLLLALTGSFYGVKTYANYKISNDIQKQNIMLIENYKKNNLNTELKLYMLSDDRYGWSLPYVSSYHEYWFKNFYNIADVNINWQEYK